MNGRKHNYGYNGQETEESLGLNVSEMTFRQYDPAIGRFNVIDAAAELAQNWTPYRFGFNNPIKFSDPSGLWEIKDGNWYTNDSKDIERFVNMLGFEKSNTGEEASIAQIDTFISEEFRGSGGRLSDGSALLDSETVVADSNGNSNGFSERQAFHIGSQVENFGSNPWNEKSGLYDNPFYSYKYYRERSWESRGGSFPGIKLGFFGSKYAQSLLYNPGNWWYSTKVNKFYDWSFTGNGHTGGRNKYIGNISKKWSKYAGNAGKAFGVYSLYNTAGQYQDGTLTAFGAVYIGGVDGAALGSKNLNVAAWSLGTGIGKSIVESNWYFNAVHNDINW
ncbi:RHS repeat-associated protein [Aquimarina sp. MAR_2010_214]|nr:RHS repeat-associated protein [Aquimarina sp. MAR_2010_214]